MDDLPALVDVPRREWHRGYLISRNGLAHTHSRPGRLTDCEPDEAYNDVSEWRFATPEQRRALGLALCQHCENV